MTEDVGRVGPRKLIVLYQKKTLPRGRGFSNYLNNTDTSLVCELDYRAASAVWLAVIQISSLIGCEVKIACGIEHDTA